MSANSKLVDRVEMWKIKQKKVIIIVAVILFLSVIISLFSNSSNVVEIKPEIKSNESGNSNFSVMNTTQNTTNANNNTISIPLEKPPFIKD